MLLENRSDRRPCHAMPQILQRALDAGVAPARILGRHPHGQAANLQEHAGPSRPMLRVCPFPRDELPMPSQNRVRRDDCGDLAQDAPSQPMPQDGEPPPVVIRELEPLPTQLASKDPILFNQVGHGTSLLAIQPANHDREHHLESRRVDHGGSLYHSVRMVPFPRRRPTCGTLRPHAFDAQLRFQDTVLFAQVLDDLVLSALKPSHERRDEQLQRNHAPSLRQLPAMFSDTTGC